MKTTKLALIPLCIGILLLLLSWYMSFPVSIDSEYDFIYNHISPLYWVSLPILFASFYIIAMNTKSDVIKWIMSFSTVLLIYSLSYFHYRVSSSDANSFRGFTEYFMSTGDLSAEGTRSYFQWPLFFILNMVATSLTNLDLRYFEFILYAIIGFLIASCLYIYASKANANGYTATVTFSIIMFFFFNYQWAPFSLCICLLLMLFLLDGYTIRKRETILAMSIIFLSMSFMHAFVPVFFIVYSLIRYIIDKNQKYLRLFLLTSIIYLTVNLFTSGAYIFNIVETLRSIYTLEYFNRFEATMRSAIAPRPNIDLIAQTISKVVVITTTIVTGLGFIVLFIRKKLRKIDHAILFTGILYITLGSFIHVLGTRAFFIVAIPASLGYCYLANSKFKKYFRSLLLILFILFTFSMVHNSFYDVQIFSQTETEYRLANFIIENYNWNYPSRLLSHIRFREYLKRKAPIENVWLTSDLSSGFPEDIRENDCVVFTVGIGKSLLRNNYSTQESLSEFERDKYNLIYNSGRLSYIFFNVPQR